MDYVDGEVLSTFLSFGCRDDIKTSISKQLDHILELLSKNNFVHGDLRSENIMITKSNKVQVIDFDLASCLISYQHDAYRIGVIKQSLTK